MGKVKKLLVRSGMLPQDTYDEMEFLKRDRFGSNNGNLIYQYSVIRTLMTHEVEIYSDNYMSNPDKAEYINNNFDAYIIPLADAFRDSFINKIKNYTKLINKLDIPVVVIGVGLKAPYDYDVKKGFSFDTDVKNFIEAVLKKSEIIGLRGQITADYLESLGFVPEKDFTVIGCPSMYTFGKDLNLKNLTLTPNSKVSLNASNIASEQSLALLNEIALKYQNYAFVPQSYQELLLNYFGFGEINNVPPNFPKNIGHKFYREGKVKYFLNAHTWFEYMKDRDLSIGTRLHGNIVATINGTPSITIIHDARMKELADYHALPSVPGNEIHKFANLTELVNSINFDEVQITQAKRFEHYLEFIEKNGFDHIYKEDRNVTDAPLDNLIAKTQFDYPIKTITAISDEERLIRLTKGFKNYENRQRRLNKK